MLKSQCTMKDVAQRFGVSTYTVSRALNGKRGVSEALRTKIIETAQEMGYVPNIAARGLQSGSTKTVAIVLDDLQNLYYSVLLSKFIKKLNGVGYHVTIFTERDSISTLNNSLMQRVLSSNPDGIISFLRSDEDACSLNRVWKRPLIVLGTEESDEQTDSLFFDDRAGGRQVTEYLLSCGCRRVGYINATTKLLPGMRRFDGYRETLEARGLYDEKIVVHLENRQILVEDAVKELLAEGVDGIFCFSDMTALHALWALKHIIGGNRVRVAGWDHIGGEVRLPCSFATVDVDFDRVVSDAVKLFQKRVGGEVFPAVHRMYPVKLIKEE